MKKIFFLTLVIIGFLTITCTFAETITLKSGKSIEGKIVEKTEEYIKVDSSGIPLTYYMDDIESIGGKILSRSLSKEENYVDSSNYQDYLQKGMAYIKKEKFEDAITEYKKAIKINQDSALAYGKVGWLYNILGKPNEAISYLEKAIKLNPHDALAYGDLGFAYYTLKKFETAINYFNKALKENPEFVPAYDWLAKIYYYSGDFNKAISCLNKMISLEPHNANTYSLLGFTHMQLKNYDLAKKNILKAKELYKKKNDYQNVEMMEKTLDRISSSLKK